MDPYYWDPNGEFFFQIHNFVLDLLVKQGAVGFSFFVLLLYFLLKIALKNRDQISIYMFLTLLFYILFSLFNTNFLDRWNLLMLVYPAAVILHQNKYMAKSESTLVR